MFFKKKPALPITLDNTFFGKGALSRKSFLRHSLSLGLCLFILNILFIFLYKFARKTDSPTFYILAIILGAVPNVFSLMIFIRLCGRRSLDIFYPRGNGLFFLLLNIQLVLPLIGIYYYFFLLFQKGTLSENFSGKIPLKKHLLIGILSPLLLCLIIRLTILPPYYAEKNTEIFKTENISIFDKTDKIIRYIFTDNMDPSFHYIQDVFSEFREISLMKDFYSSKDSLKNHPEFFLENYLKRNQIKPFTVTGIVLGVASNSLFVFREKEENKKSSKDQDAVNISAALKMINTNLTIINLSKNRLTPIHQAAPYGIFFLTGSTEVYLLELVDDLIYYKFLDVSYKKLKENLDKVKVTLNSSKRFDPKWDALKKELQETETHFNEATSFIPHKIIETTSKIVHYFD